MLNREEFLNMPTREAKEAITTEMDYVIYKIKKALVDKDVKVKFASELGEFVPDETVAIKVEEAKGNGIYTQQTISLFYYISKTNAETRMYLFRKAIIEALEQLINRGELRPLYKLTPIKLLDDLACQREDFVISLLEK